MEHPDIVTHTHNTDHEIKLRSDIIQISATIHHTNNDLLCLSYSISYSQITRSLYHPDHIYIIAISSELDHLYHIYIIIANSYLYLYFIARSSSHVLIPILSLPWQVSIGFPPGFPRCLSLRRIHRRVGWVGEAAAIDGAERPKAAAALGPGGCPKVRGFGV